MSGNYKESYVEIYMACHGRVPIDFDTLTEAECQHHVLKHKARVQQMLQRCCQELPEVQNTSFHTVDEAYGSNHGDEEVPLDDNAIVGVSVGWKLVHPRIWVRSRDLSPGSELNPSEVFHM